MASFYFLRVFKKSINLDFYFFLVQTVQAVVVWGVEAVLIFQKIVGKEAIAFPDAPSIETSIDNVFALERSIFELNVLAL